MFALPRIGRRAGRNPGALRRRSVVTTMALIAGTTTGAAVISLTSAPAALADTPPPAPAGWNTVFSDDFAGAAGSAPSSANWFYDIGSGFGTGEKENTTSSTNNVYLDGNGHLVLKALNNGGTWTSARIESTRDDFQAPPGGELEMSASIQQPNPSGGLGYWPAFWALGSPMRSGGGWPQSGEIDMMEDVNALNEASQTLHDSANSPGHALIACPNTASTCQTGYHTYSVIIDRTNTAAEQLLFQMDGVTESTITEASVGTAAWQSAIDHGFFIIWDLAMGGNYPDGISGTTTPTSATTSGGFMSAAWVAVYEKGGNSTPTGTATATGNVKGINSQCLTNQNSLNTEGNPFFVSACNGSAGQTWSTYSDNTVRVQGGCLDVSAAGTTSGTNVDWYPCNGTNAQGWTHQANGEFVNPNSNLCLTDPGGNAATRLDIETCTGSAQQIWTGPAGGTTGNTVSVANPGNQTSTQGTAASVQISASDSASGQTLTYSASGLPAGLSINSSTGLISGTPSAAGTSNVSVTATDTTGASGSTSFTWTVNGTGGGTCNTATNLALSQPTTASSTENAGTPAGAATDGSTTTRWSSAFSDPQWLQVDLGSVQTICQVTIQWETASAKAFQIQVSNDATNWTSIYSTTTGPGGTQTLSVSGSGRYIRMYGTARNTQYGYSIWEFQVYGTGAAPSCGTTNLALNQPATASSLENATFTAGAAVDGNTGTRWSSGFSDPQWLQVDLGATHSICKVVIQWEAAYATAFQIQTSNDATNWTSIFSTTSGAGGTQTLNVTGSGRYIRMYGTARATQYGYSIWEFQVYGS
ncbi:MAG TPA: discoidin domain-containing protein [Actinocrinis sp.]|uniref:discoidin domain-containing protein n=1 Tax=Actinocrinis sp. TaxID=1920516 RepID=UPI002DDDAB18|nr:discoidin domain-containing protein [Actinocrinis sp.]HEV2343138.1 discoidin domain-containing protein [Actinocrinis sp.]